MRPVTCTFQSRRVFPREKRRCMRTQGPNKHSTDPETLTVIAPHTEVTLWHTRRLVAIVHGAISVFFFSRTISVQTMCVCFFFFHLIYEHTWGAHFFVLFVDAYRDQDSSKHILSVIEYPEIKTRRIVFIGRNKGLFPLIYKYKEWYWLILNIF